MSGKTEEMARELESNWSSATLTTASETFDLLAELYGKRWLCRGQARPYGTLVPSIDRSPRDKLSRLEKLSLERQSIDLFRSTARFFSHPGEQGAMTDDIVALMVLRHYDVPTRLLDWSLSPYVAAYFAACGHDDSKGEIWSFDQARYKKRGEEQWKRWPETTTTGDGNQDNFKAGLTAFLKEEPPDWFICGFYDTGFHRQDAQRGAYSCTAQFGRDHAESIARLLGDVNSHHRYVVPGDIKAELRTLLRKRHGIWRGSLFPDSAGAAETAKAIFPTRGAVATTVCGHDAKSERQDG